MTGRDGLTYCHSNAEDAEEEEVQCVADDECECGPVHWQQGDQQRIVGGGIAPEHAYPWQVSIFRNITEYMTKLLKFVENNNINLDQYSNINLEQKQKPKNIKFHLTHVADP